MGQKFALIIGNSEYEDASLRRLVTPGGDVDALASVLKDSAIGAFDDVQTLLNESSASIRRAIARFFAKRKSDDLLLLYFSGHGVLDEQGHLHLAARDTERDLLSGTAIPANFVTGEMDRSPSRRQVFILDCCHSGAFSRGTKGVLGASVGTGAAFEGAGFG
ncbi:MAG: caspase family protein, partial [Chloroflexota bacterium]